MVSEIGEIREDTKETGKDITGAIREARDVILAKVYRG